MTRAHSALDAAEVMERVRSTLDGAPEGMHVLQAACPVVDSELPPALAEVYRSYDGAELYQGVLVIHPSREIAERDGKYAVGEESGDDICVDAQDGSVWRLEKDSEEWLPEGSSFDRWLLGFVEAEALMYDGDGEYLEDLFDESGELTPDSTARRERQILSRDRRAPAPRWRLARALGRLGRTEEARSELEEVVEHAPRFAWAWFDLARLSERAGELSAAVEAAREAGEVAAASATSQHQAGFFLAHAARFAARSDDEALRAELAGRALGLDERLVRRNTDGARERLDAGDERGARELVELALALDPRDHDALELAESYSAN